MGYGIKLKKPAFTKDTHLYTLKSIPEVLIPVEQYHTVTVNQGDHVKIGGVLGVSFSAQTPLLSSVSGTVGGVYNIKGHEYIRIVNDNKYQLSNTITPCKKRLSEMSREEMIERIRVCGISEWKQLCTAKGIARFIINCADSDPYANKNKCIIKNKRSELIGGAKIIMKLLSVRLCEFVIEKNETEAINILVDSIGDSKLFDIVEISPKYPYGEPERLLTQLPDSETLSEEELFVLSPDVVCAVYMAFAKGIPYVRRAVTVGGSAAYAKGTYLLPLGTPVKYLTDNVTSKENGAEPFSVIKNGTMSGSFATTEDAVITSSTHTLTYINNSELSLNTDACISCGKCDRVCPDGLLPSLFIEKHSDNFTDALGLSGMDLCSGCGACSYVCPAKLPIHEIAREDASLPKPNEYHKKRVQKHAPFITSTDNATTINLDIALCLAVLLAWSVCVFGTRALIVSLVCVASAVVSDLLFSLLTKLSLRSTLTLSSLVCGLACAMTMTVRVPLYLCAAAPFIAIVLVRGAFGGRSKNIIHSVFCARIFISLLWHEPFIYPERAYTMFDRILGNTAGGLGEISALLIAVCALYLIIRKITPVTPIIATLSSLSIITFLTSETGNAANNMSISLLGSAILFVSVFNSSEYSTIPKGITGQIAYGIVCGSLSALIVRFTDHEGAYIAAVLASLATVPLFSRIRQAEPLPLDDGTATEPNVDLEAIFGKEENDETDVQDNISSIPERTVPATTEIPHVENTTPSKNESASFSERPKHKAPDESRAADARTADVRTADASRFDTENFHIDSAEELLSILTAELGMNTEEQQVQTTNEQSELKIENDAEYSTAMFDRLYDELDVSNPPDKK